ncbi:MAG: hypothetical protein JWO36_3733 [Myxococcales bacterium]|nr:hypothetical protein [Myxococcales bacterium]
MAEKQPTLRWKVRVGFGGGHHAYGGKLSVHPFGVVASGGSREDQMAVVNPARGEIRLAHQAECIGVVGSTVAVSTTKCEMALKGRVTLYDTTTGAQQVLALPAGETAAFIDERSMFVRAKSGDGHTFCERRFDLLHGVGDVVRAFPSDGWADGASGTFVYAKKKVYDRETGEQLGQGGFNIALADPDWFACETDRLELHRREGLQWTVAHAQLIRWDPRFVIVTLSPAADSSKREGSSLAILDRATGCTLHSIEAGREESREGWGKAIVCDGYLVANDKRDPRDRSITRAFAFDGTELWKLHLDENVWVADFAAAAGRLYVLSATGYLYAFDR